MFDRALYLEAISVSWGQNSTTMTIIYSDCTPLGQGNCFNNEENNLKLIGYVEMYRLESK